MAKPNPVDRLSKFIGDWLSNLFLIAVVLSAFEVVMRYVFNAPTIWVHDSAIALSATAFIFGGAYALQRREHITISIVRDAMPPPVRRVLDVVNAALIVAFVAVLTYAATRMAIPSVQLMETSGHAWDVPIPALLKSLLALGSALLLAQALVQLWQAVTGRGRNGADAA